MDKTKKIWLNGDLIDWDDAQVHVLNHSLHYGAGVFEGIRFYNTPKGPAIFRLQDHTDRLFYSAKSVGMDLAYTKDQINQAIIDTVKASGIESGYIRPIASYGYGKMGVNPMGVPMNVCIAVWPWGKYLEKDAVKIKISKYIRIHPKSTIADAKICGHYVNSILAILEIKKEGYDEALLLDHNGNVAEGPGENIFWIKNGVLYTTPKGNILPGITRSTIMTIANDIGIEVVEEYIKPDELKKVDETFFCGTAAEVTAIGQIDEVMIGSGGVGEITEKIKNMYLGIVRGGSEKYNEWLRVI